MTFNDWMESLLLIIPVSVVTTILYWIVRETLFPPKSVERRPTEDDELLELANQVLDETTQRIHSTLPGPSPYQYPRSPSPQSPGQTPLNEPRRMVWGRRNRRDPLPVWVRKQQLKKKLRVRNRHLVKKHRRMTQELDRAMREAQGSEAVRHLTQHMKRLSDQR